MKRYWAVNLLTGEGVWVYARTIPTAYIKAAKALLDAGAVCCAPAQYRINLLVEEKPE